MRSNNNLNEYGNDIIPLKHKFIFKYAIILSVIFIAIFAISTIFYHDFYKCIIGFILGSIGCIILFYKTHVIVDSTHYVQYKKMIKKIHIMYQITYIVLFALLLVLLKSILSIVGLSLGLLMIKISSVIETLIRKD